MAEVDFDVLEEQVTEIQRDRVSTRSRAVYENHMDALLHGWFAINPTTFHLPLRRNSAMYQASLPVCLVLGCSRWRSQTEAASATQH
ncbi:hypothetical protein L917_07179 [Phytophthora nicotianae]|uniref:Uncharacterized protein n=1 Tax=Phytophthora nicotianae TaxID=4792 RepID=W2LC13_PHYNI|nr:hypothetical protein L917_07179 [Phytophthora nicotianae]